MTAGNNNLEDLPPGITQLQALKVLDVVNNDLLFLSAEVTTMTLTNLNVHTNPWHLDPANTAPQGDGPRAVDCSTRVHFCVPPLREVVLRYLLEPSANQRRLPAPSHPSSTTTTTSIASASVSAARQSTTTTLEDCFQLPLQEGALTPTDAARLVPSAVSAPRRHAFSRATTSGPKRGPVLLLLPLNQVGTGIREHDSSWRWGWGLRRRGRVQHQRRPRRKGRNGSRRALVVVRPCGTWRCLGHGRGRASARPLSCPRRSGTRGWACWQACTRWRDDGVPLLWRGCGSG